MSILSSRVDGISNTFSIVPSALGHSKEEQCEGYLFYSANFNIKHADKGITLDPLQVPLSPIEIGEQITLRNIFFETAQYELLPTSKVELKTLLDILEKNPQIKVEIAGHTDNVGKSEANQTLSEQRAQSVYNWLIENGIDVPNANTLIIEDADHMGLAQLHQIRGRVGRSNRRASAYLTFRRDKVLTEIAEKRLNAIRDFATFGSGVKIAMRDLEIRGVGNLLGAEQSGHMIDVGYDMYMKLLNEAVLEARGIPVQSRAECSADLAVTAGIPDRYVPSAEQRMDLYRRIALIRREEEADDLLDELIDRFGDPPPGVTALIHIALLRGEAGEAGITDISQKQGSLRFELRQFDMERVSALYATAEYKGRLRVEAGSKPGLSLRIRAKTRVVEEARRFVADWAKTGRKAEN